MRTYVNPKNDQVAIATSSSPSHHKVMVTDDFGNVLDTVHYSGVTVSRVIEIITTESGFIPSKGEMF